MLGLQTLRRMWAGETPALKPVKPAGRRAPKGAGQKYDAAATTDENRRHWSNADDLSPNAANSADVRRLLRIRSRYECGNSGYLGGTVRTQAEDLIGTGPRIELEIPGVETSVSKRIARSYRKWCDAILLPEKLLVLDEGKRRDGELFAVLKTNPGVRHPVKLDVMLLETEQVADPSLMAPTTDLDGITLDAHGNPTKYSVLKQHPGDRLLGMGTRDATEVRAADVLHWFRPDRPRQGRGVPETKAALPLGSILRRYTLAALGAAEWAASIFGVMEVPAPEDPSDADETPEAMDRVEVERGAILTVPKGAGVSQLEAEQPTATYKEFNSAVLNEMGRGMGSGVPFNVIAGNSSGYNYSSGRLDHLPYHRSIRITRNLLRLRVLDPLFLAWVEEASLIPEPEGGLPLGLPDVGEWEWVWNWDGFDSIDPLKDADTDTSRLASSTTNFAEVYAEYGQDWETQIGQRVKEIKRVMEMAEAEGLDPAIALKLLFPDTAPAQRAPEPEPANVA